MKDSERYRLEADKAEDVAKQIPYEIERQQALKIASEWRDLEAVALRREKRPMRPDTG